MWSFIIQSGFSVSSIHKQKALFHFVRAVSLKQPAARGERCIFNSSCRADVSCSTWLTAGGCPALNYRRLNFLLTCTFCHQLRHHAKVSSPSNKPRDTKQKFWRDGKCFTTWRGSSRLGICAFFLLIGERSKHWQSGNYGVMESLSLWWIAPLHSSC